MPSDRRWQPKGSAAKDGVSSAERAGASSAGAGGASGKSAAGSRGSAPVAQHSNAALPAGGSAAPNGKDERERRDGERRSSAAGRGGASSNAGKDRRRKRRVRKNTGGGAAGSSQGDPREDDKAAEQLASARKEEELRLREEEEARLKAEEELARRVDEGLNWYKDVCGDFLRRKALRESNLNAGPASETELRQLDSSLKRCTGFVRKLRSGVSDDGKDTLLTEAAGLNLSRYTSELVSAIAESKLRASDVNVLVEVCSVLHRRLPEFGQDLAPMLARLSAGSTAGGAPRADAATRRGAIRLLAELVCVGVVVDESHVFNSVREMLKAPMEADREVALANLSVVASLAKSHGREFVGSKLRNPYTDVIDKVIAKSAEGGGPTATIDEIVETERSFVSQAVRSAIRTSLDAYFAHVCRNLSSAHASFRKAEAENIFARQSRGEIPEEQVATYEREKKVFEKTLAGATFLAEALDNELPKLQEDEKTTRLIQRETRGAAASAAAASVAAEKQEPRFEDEAERAFYEDLVDLSEFIPSEHVAEEGTGPTEVDDHRDEARGENRAETKAESKGETKADRSAADGPAEATASSKGDRRHEKDTDKSSARASTPGEREQDSKAGEEPKSNVLHGAPKQSSLGKKGKTNSSLSAAGESLAADLNSCDSLEGTDNFAKAFAVTANRSSCRRLIRAMLATPPQRLNVLPYYARLAATLGKHFPEVSSGLLQSLEDEFKHLISRKDQDEKLLVIRVRNSNFLGELCKFRVVPASTVFDLVNRCLSDFTYHNVDVVCSILENCGRYLYRNPETAVRTGNMLDKMWRLKSVKNLDARHSALVETAYFASRPPERAYQKAKKEKDPLLEYIRRQILHAELTKANFEWSVRQMRKLPWDEPLDNYVARKILKAERLRFSSLNLTAPLVASVAKYREGLGIAVIDGLLEAIRYGLEVNDVRLNQRRIAELKLLGEFYNCHSIDSALVFEVLYLLITLGHDTSSDIVAPDPVGDFFRARLVCVLLDTCGKNIDRGVHKERLNVFLTYFELYLHLKCSTAGFGDTLPRETEFFVGETMEALRKGQRRPETLEQARDDVAAVEASNTLSSMVMLPRVELRKPGLADGAGKRGELGNLRPPANSSTHGDNDDDVEDTDGDGEEHDEEDHIDANGECDDLSSAEGDEADVDLSADHSDVVDDDDEDEDDDDEDDDDDDDEEEEADVDLEDDEFDDDDDDDDEDDDEDDVEDDDDDDDEKVAVTRPPLPRTDEEEEFDRELANLTAESLSTAKTNKNTSSFERMTVPMSMIGRSNPTNWPADGSGDKTAGREPGSQQPGTVAFRMLYRRGGKNQTKELAVPAESALATAAKVSEDTERQQQQEMKRLVLGSNTVLGGEVEGRSSDTGEASRGAGKGTPSRKAKKSDDEANILSALFKTNKQV